nr:MAG TPA: hypothetical protein [Bacteriophage sp.]
MLYRLNDNETNHYKTLYYNQCIDMIHSLYLTHIIPYLY